MQICNRCETVNPAGFQYCSACGSPLPKLSGLLDACLLISSKITENHHFGTGFIIHHDEEASYIFTCAHVVNDVGGENFLQVDGRPAKLLAIGDNDGLDLAVLRTSPLNKSIINLGLYTNVGNPFTTSGYHSFGRHYSMSSLKGRVVSQVLLTSKNITSRFKAWNLSIEDNDTLQDGYSGSPVIDLESGYCFGVMTYKHDGGLSGLAISVDEVKQIWSSMPRELIQISLDDVSTRSQKLFSRATRNHIMGDLGQALAIYKHLKMIDPSYPRIDMTIQSVEQEMRKGYVNRFGQIDKELVQQEKTAEQKVIVIPATVDISEQTTGIPLAKCGCILLLGVFVFLIAIGIFLWLR